MPFRAQGISKSPAYREPAAIDSGAVIFYRQVNGFLHRHSPGNAARPGEVAATEADDYATDAFADNSHYTNP
jgi:hypothetical protein